MGERYRPERDPELLALEWEVAALRRLLQRARLRVAAYQANGARRTEADVERLTRALLGSDDRD